MTVGSLRPGARYALVALGGGMGGALRWGLGVAVPDGDGFPWTTFAINTVGSLLLALLPLVLYAVPRLRPATRQGLAALVGPGLLGGFTTLSTYSLQARGLLAAGNPGLAAAYLLGTLLAATLAVGLAQVVGARWLERRDG